jgi:hypothetical protein
MDSQKSLEAFRTQLQAQGLPSWYVERLVQELSDHLDDVKEHGCMGKDASKTTAESQVGDPEQIARLAVGEFRKRSLFQRRPGLKRLALCLAFSLFVLSAFLTTSPDLVAGDYLVTTQIENRKGQVACPRVTVAANQDATVSFQDGSVTYDLTIKAGDGTGTAMHNVRLRVTETNEEGQETCLAFPRVIINATGNARIQVGDWVLNLKVDECKKGK